MGALAQREFNETSERVIAPLRGDNAPLRAIKANWGKAPVCLTTPWVDISALPLEPDEIEKFLRSLPERCVYARIPGAEPGAAAERVPLPDAPFRERFLEGPMHIVALDLHEHDERFARVLNDFLDFMTPVLGSLRNNDLQMTIGAFMAGGKSIVPFHADFEHNFLIHTHGEKYMHIFPSSDYKIFTSRARERMAKDMTAGRFLPYHEEFESQGSIIHLKPGVASYQPPLSPHWVENFDDYSLSILISLFTRAELELRMTHLANGMLRKMGIRPGRDGLYPRRDAAKAWLGIQARNAARLARRRVVSRGRVIER